MAITTLNASDSGVTSRTVINDNFTDLDTTKADLASPTFTGTPTLPTGTVAVTQTAGDNSTKVATTAYADTAAQTTNFSTTQVFNGTSPTSFTDLDLSSVVGVTSRIVLLVVTVSSTVYINTKRKGTSYTYPSGSTSSIGVSSGISNTNQSTNLLVRTDSSGVIQWSTNSAVTAQINVEAYW